jgi:hypothetical protein
MDILVIRGRVFIDHPWITMSGASPDGLAAEGLVEIKCPNTATHIETLLTKTVPAKYITQMMWQMACADRPWCDFVSLTLGCLRNISYSSKRINYDPEMVNLLENSVIQFLGDVDLKIQQLESLAMKKFKNIVVITGTYKTKDGQEKKRYQNIGSVFLDDNDNLKIKMDSMPLVEGGWNGWANCYDLEEKANKQEARHDDIPF